jgi:hypothetical protein
MSRPSRKRGNPDYVSSSFYLPKKTNFAFDLAVLNMRAGGHSLDRSDVIAALLDRWSKNPKPLSKI